MVLSWKPWLSRNSLLIFSNVVLKLHNGIAWLFSCSDSFSVMNDLYIAMTDPFKSSMATDLEFEYVGSKSSKASIVWFIITHSGPKFSSRVVLWFITLKLSLALFNGRSDKIM